MASRYPRCRATAPAYRCPQTASLRMTVEAAMRVTGALGDWAAWANQESSRMS